MSTLVVRLILVLIEIGGKLRDSPPALKVDVSTSSTSSVSSFASTAFQPVSFVLRTVSAPVDQTSGPPLVTRIETLNLEPICPATWPTAVGQHGPSTSLGSHRPMSMSA